MYANQYNVGMDTDKAPQAAAPTMGGMPPGGMAPMGGM